MSKLAPVYKSVEDCSVERFKLYDMHFKMSVFVQSIPFIIYLMQFRQEWWALKDRWI